MLRLQQLEGPENPLALGELKEAENALREAARREPDSLIILNNLAQTLSDQGRDEEALPRRS
jgi:hypothetical protein